LQVYIKYFLPMRSCADYPWCSVTT